MSTRLKVIGFTCLDGETNMGLDAGLLALCERNPVYGFLRFYTWAPPALSMGRLEPDGAVDRAAARRDGIAVVRRPTGGRTVLHCDDITYTIVMPRHQDAGLQATYMRLSEVLVDGLSSLGARVDIERGKTGRARMVQRPCFASVSRYEVTSRGRKVVGSAQRISERALLQHGSIPLGPGYLNVVDYISVPPDARERLRGEMEAGTSCLEQVLGRHVEAVQVADALTEAFRRGFGSRLEPLAVDEMDALVPGDLSSRFRGREVVSTGDKSP